MKQASEEVNIIDKIHLYIATEKLDNETKELLNDAAKILSILHNQIYFIAYDYIELSYEKIEWQRNDYIKRCRKLLTNFYSD